MSVKVKITKEFVDNALANGNGVDLVQTVSRTIFPSSHQKSGHQGTRTMDDSIVKPLNNNGKVNEESQERDPTEISLLVDAKCFDGRQQVFKHYSKETKSFMKFSIYVPEQKNPDERFHVVFFLSGIMCNEQNFLFKSGFQQHACEHRLIVVGADTSPRECSIPGDRDSAIFGRSAGWYLDATEHPWKDNYRMYSYISKELPEVIRANFSSISTGKFGIVGHSMGGNGTIVVGLRNPNLFSSLSLLSPSCNPTSWGQEIIFSKFLGTNSEMWNQYDACHVVREYAGPHREIILDIGSEDEYMEFLRPHKLHAESESNSNNCVKIHLEVHDGYDHSYYFVASFIEKHFRFHKKKLDEHK